MIKNRYIVSTGIQDVADTVTKSRSFLSPELNFDPPRVYEYIRGVFALPHTNSLTECPSQMNFDPGFFMHVFRSLKPRILQNPTRKECSLFCDALSIKSSVYYNNSSGNYDSYVNYGEGNVVSDEDTAAKEA